MAEALFRRMLDDAGRQDITVESAGTGAYDGAPASEGAFLIAVEAGLDLTRHRARLLDSALVSEADLILTMSKGHLTRVERLGGAGKAYLLGAYANASPEESELRDPYGGDVEGYRQTLQQLERLLFSARERLLAETPR
jgi:protein-tyrosine-phosphatase